jgi:hypothetical protein
MIYSQLQYDIPDAFHQVLLCFLELNYSFEYNLIDTCIPKYLLLTYQICFWIHVAEDANTTICAKKDENCTRDARSKLNMYFFP